MTSSMRLRRLPLATPDRQRDRLGEAPLAREFDATLQQAGLWPLTPLGIDVLQINVGRFCNQTCLHCHVDAGPDRTDEMMTRETMTLCLEALDRAPIRTVDITGGAPELHAHFRWLVEACCSRGRHVIDRCNLTVLELPSQRGLAGFLADHQVEIVCSLPHYRALNTDRQRGAGVYEKSIAALQRLNALGYGNGTSGRRLVLVTNPPGAVLPGSQRSLEAEWTRELQRLHGIRFDALYCLTNMPIGRFLEWLDTSGNLASYLQRLAAGFNPAAVNGLMCRSTLSVGWDGRLYDCDFNQMLGLETTAGVPRHIRDFQREALLRREVVTGRHCFGCTAGAGSSCSGATAGSATRQ
jgi:radical SAM/Cys-rich protein